MVTASSRDALRRSLVGIAIEIQGTDYSEVAFETGGFLSNFQLHLPRLFPRRPALRPFSGPYFLFPSPGQGKAHKLIIYPRPLYPRLPPTP
jgi:hypothetical protein